MLLYPKLKYNCSLISTSNYQRLSIFSEKLIWIRSGWDQRIKHINKHVSEKYWIYWPEMDIITIFHWSRSAEKFHWWVFITIHVPSEPRVQDDWFQPFRKVSVYGKEIRPENFKTTIPIFCRDPKSRSICTCHSVEYRFKNFKILRRKP